MISSLALQYTRWLYDRVCVVRDYDSSRSYINLCGEMQDMLFGVIVPLDENRRLDGRDLRDEFLDYIQDKALDREVERAHEVTLLELFVGLAARARLMTGMEEYQWFEIFLKNLGLDGCSDRTFDIIARQKARRILRRFVNRRYRANGMGGLFPLNMPLCDQRDAELWSQMGAYIRENYLD